MVTETGVNPGAGAGGAAKPAPAGPPAGGAAPRPGGPTRDQRRAVVAAAAARALGRADPLAAGLGLVTADLLEFAFAQRDRVQAALAGPAAREEFPAETDVYLRLVKQVDRMARVERDLAARPEDAGGAAGETPRR